ncbi:MAG: hypothetical protein PF442_08220 [Desulfobulbaceae bacterium]|jgi:hypothetical protein|nr:hypothetical protein [Desulfobulbaceae bacterium]
MNGFNLKQMLVPFLVILSLAFTGCVASDSSADVADGLAVQEEINAPFYHMAYKEFLLPAGLVLDKEETRFVHTDSFTGGNLRFTGKLEIESLAGFFVNSMPKNGWKRVYSNVGSEILQAYTKDKATCIVKITESRFKTIVDIYVADVTGK